VSKPTLSESADAATADRVLRERAHFDKLADDLGNVWWGHKTRAGQTRLDHRGQLVERWAKIGPGSVVLEPGAGSGEFSGRLARTGARIVAVELSPKQARLGRTRLSDLANLRFTVGDVNRLPHPDNTFDAVIGCSVLHHLHMPPALQEFRRVLKPGGRFLFSEPNMLNPQIALEKNVPSIKRQLCRRTGD
jgi:ubiquinone/menaquinone biosynthesis C-methylase UbiE